MSYKRPDTGDPERDRQWIDEDYGMLFPQLLEALSRDIGDAGDDPRFAAWLNKLALIDRDRVAAYLRASWASLDRTRRIIAKLRLKELRDLPVE